MKLFKVAYHYEQRGFVNIAAKTPEEAEKIIAEDLEEYGTDRLDDIKVLYREYGATNAEEVDHESE